MLILIKNLVKIEKKESVFNAILRSSFLNLLARFFGYLKNLSIAVLLGFGPETDGFFMALSLLGLFLIFADVFDSIGVPQLVKSSQESKERFIEITGLLFIFTTILSFSLTGIAFLVLPFLLRVPSGFSLEAIKSMEVSYLYLLPYLFFSFYFHHFGAILRSQRRFTEYFIGEFIFSFFSSFFIIFGLWLKLGFVILSISFSLSQIIATLYIVFVCRNFLHYKFFIDDLTIKMLKQFVQLLSVYGVFHVYTLVDKTFASHLESKSVSALTYGLLIVGVVRGILKFENIVITSLSESGGSLEKLNFYAKKLIYVTVPSSVLLFLFSDFIVKILLGYGSFSQVDTKLTAEAVRYYSLSLYFMFLWPIIFRVFQIRNKMLPVAMISILGAIINTVVNYLSVFILNYGIMGICFGTFISYMIICLFGYYLLAFKNLGGVSK